MLDAQELQKKLNALSDVYVAQLPSKLEQIEHLWNKLPADQWDEENFQALYRAVHGLTGSGKTFGFSALGDVARDLEIYLKPYMQTRSALSSAQREQVQKMLEQLQVASTQRDTPGQDMFAGTLAQPSHETAGCRLVFVVEDDAVQAAELKVQLSYFGYEVRVFNGLASFRLAMQQQPDVVILMDINFPEDRMGGIHAIEEIQKGLQKPVPVIFLSTHDDFATRLAAVRAGSIAYVAKPLHIGNLIDRLDELTSNVIPAAYRVLIIDDTVVLTDFYAAALEQAGMDVSVVNDPLQVMPMLKDFSPDLIVIDMYMPGCNGMELAKVIRQMDAYVSIPIVFLSAEQDINKQLIAMKLGADDFLSKPIQAEHLVSSVTSRIRRSALLRSFMVRDSLTGLLNHSAIKEQLDREVARAKRQGAPLSFAMVDIDYFKHVNDTYGHATGDRVLKSLSRLLKQRLRETDMVGRYGGEEFALILVNTDAESAVRVMDAIREDFSKLSHQSGDTEFFVTFSCGIADVAQFGDVAQLGSAADKALYQAKHAGRNQVIRAGAVSIG